MTQTETSSASPTDEVTRRVRQAAGIEDGALIVWCNEQFEKCKKARLQFERQWFVNLAFYFSKQYVQWASNVASNYAKLWEPPVPPWRVRLVANKVKPILRAELAKMTREKPTGFVVPNSTDDDDILAAQAGEQIIEYMWRVLQMPKVVRQAAFWTALTGNGFIKDWYDPDALDPMGTKGSIQIENVTPFHLWIPETSEPEIENQPYVIHGLAKDQDWVEQRFGKKIPPDSSNTGASLEQKFLNAIGIQDGSTKGHVAVKEIWVKPCKKFTSGAHIIWAGDTLLAKDEYLPYKHRQYPFTKLDHIPTGRFYTESTVVDLIPLQKEYNRTRSQIIEAKNRMAKPQLVAPKGSIDPKKITTEPGLVVFYTPGFNEPKPLPLQSLPSYVIEELDRCQRDMDDISSQHEVTKGRTPPGVTAATAISYLQEEDDSKLAWTIASIEEGVEKVGRHILTHVQEFWDSAHTVKVVGDNGEFEAMEFTKQDIAGNTDFHIEPGSATPRSLAAKQAFIMEAYKAGLVPPDKALRYLNMAETGKMYEELQVDSRHAQRENLRMMRMEGLQTPQVPIIDPMTQQPAVDPTGQPLMQPGPPNFPINSWDEHMTHILEHNLYRKRQKFENADPEVRRIFDAHVEAHKQAVAAMMGQPLPPGDPRLDAIIRGLPVGGGQPQAGGAGMSRQTGPVPSQGDFSQSQVSPADASGVS